MVTRTASATASHVIDLRADGTTVELIEANVPIRVASSVAMLGTQTGLAKYLGVAKTQPGRWLKLAETPTPATLRLLVDLDYVWTRLTSEMGEDAAGIWLRSANPFLAGAVPLEWIKVHGPADVIAAFDAAEAGSYA